MDKKRRKSAAQNTPHVGGILSHANNTVITGGHFVNIVNQSNGGASKDGFELLQEHVATSAFHDSAQRIDPPRCHENTRQAVLQEIHHWIEEEETRTTWLAWLNGAAGAGKSAICQTMAEMCITQGIMVASFFFFRTDTTRNTIRPLVATLAYQIIRLLPATKDAIVQAIEANPLVFQQTFNTQFDELIARPLRQLSLSSPGVKVLLIIDGVDECDGYDSQKAIILFLARLLRAKDVPVIVLFGSRQEVQIQVTFNSAEVSRILFRLPLDAHYLPDDDIRLFLHDGFREIHLTHPFNVNLDSSWPGPTLVQEIIDKSSGQFIYASVVMRFVASPRSNPAAQLDIVRGLRPTKSATPFAQLDALYRHIFSRVEDLDTVTTILAYSVIGRTTVLDEISAVVGIAKPDLPVTLVDLVSVIACDSASIRFLHASLPDFLIDQTRSLEYSISHPLWSTRIAIMWYQSQKLAAAAARMAPNVNNFLKHAEPTPELRECIFAFDPATLASVYALLPYLNCVKNLDLGDRGKVYRHQLNLATRHLLDEIKADSEYAGELPRFKEAHDISDILAEIEREEADRRARSKRAKIKAWFKRMA